MSKRRGVYVVMREVATDELRVCHLAKSYKSEAGYTLSEPYPSRAAAIRAIKRKDESLRRQLYPEVATP